MARYTGEVGGITPNTANDNWTLNTAASAGTVSGRITEVNWGGEVTVSTAMRTAIARDSAQGVTAVNGNVQKTHPNSPSNNIAFVSSWTTQPTLAAGALFGTSWNAHGGVVRWLAAPGEEFVIISSAGISCRNAVGTAASTYGLLWEED